MDEIEHTPNIPSPRPGEFKGARIEDVLRLRRWTVSVLATGAPALDRMPSAAPASWRLFLFTERCAFPLAERLGSAVSALDAPVAGILQRRAMREQQRVQHARTQLRGISTLVRDVPGPVVILKGGAHALSGGTLDLNDLDLLTTSSIAEQLERRLEGVGFVRTAGHERNAQRRLSRPGDLHVELHVGSTYAVDLDAVMARAVPAEESLCRLAPADNLGHILLHSARDYGRIGSVRDLLLLAAAAKECSVVECERVLRELSAHPRSPVMFALYDTARGLLGGIAPGPRFTGAAAARCIVAAELPGLALPAQFEAKLMLVMFSLLEGGIGLRGVLRRSLEELDKPSPMPALERFLRAAPRVARVARAAGRTAQSLAAAPAAALLARRARRLAARA